MEKSQSAKAGELYANILIGFTIFLILETIAGIWVKLFWMGWVFA